MRSSKLILCLILSLLCPIALPSTGQKANQKEQPNVSFEEMRAVVLEIQKKSHAARERGNLLTELDTVRALEKEYAPKGAAAQTAIATLLLTLNSFAGNYREALHYADIVQNKPATDSPLTSNSLTGYKAVDAITAITRAAEKAQVVMINEAHHVPQHRAFTKQLLESLRRKGFTYFAAEALGDTDTNLNKRGYPTTETGYYISEPVFGDLIRAALKLGYTVVNYEPHYKDADQREREQAQNIADRILKHDPKAKILVHAGYSHIDEAGTRTGAVTMAQRFKEMTGIDPLTIDQTAMTEHGAPEYEHPLYQDVVKRGLVQRPVVFQNAQGEFWTLEKGTHDITLFHPRSRYVDGRPDWLRTDNSRRAYHLPKGICGASSHCLVSARAVDEAATAVPFDQLEITSGKPQPALLLPAGDFIIEVQDPEGKQLQKLPVRISKDR